MLKDTLNMNLLIEAGRSVLLLNVFSHYIIKYHIHWYICLRLPSCPGRRIVAEANQQVSIKSRRGDAH